MPGPRRNFSMIMGGGIGLASGAALIGLGMIGIAVAADIRSDESSLLTSHPLFVSGTELVLSGFGTGWLFFALWYLLRRQ